MQWHFQTHLAPNLSCLSGPLLSTNPNIKMLFYLFSRFFFSLKQKSRLTEYTAIVEARNWLMKTLCSRGLHKWVNTHNVRRLHRVWMQMQVLFKRTRQTISNSRTGTRLTGGQTKTNAELSENQNCYQHYGIFTCWKQEWGNARLKDFECVRLINIQGTVNGYASHASQVVLRIP